MRRAILEGGTKEMQDGGRYVGGGGRGLSRCVGGRASRCGGGYETLVRGVPAPHFIY